MGLQNLQIGTVTEDLAYGVHADFALRRSIELSETCRARSTLEQFRAEVSTVHSQFLQYRTIPRDASCDIFRCRAVLIQCYSKDVTVRTADVSSDGAYLCRVFRSNKIEIAPQCGHRDEKSSP